MAEENGPYEVQACPGCFDGLVYDGERGAWVDHKHCAGTGRARAFVYSKAPAGDAGKRLRGCEGCRERHAGRGLYEVGEDHLTFFEGDALCGACAVGHGVL